MIPRNRVQICNILNQGSIFRRVQIWYDIGRFWEWKAKIIASLQISFFPEKLKFLSFSYYSGEDNSANLPQQQQQEQGGGWESYLHRWSGLVWATVREVWLKCWPNISNANARYQDTSPWIRKRLWNYFCRIMALYVLPFSGLWILWTKRSLDISGKS